MTEFTPTAKTIQIYLPKGDPRGIRSAEMTTRTVRLIEIPRIHIDDFFAMPDTNQVGLYFLIGETESTDKPLLYIGQTGDLRRRLNQHDDKDFWTRAFVMLSTNNSMTQTHALYMEHKAISAATAIGRYEIKNGNTGNRPHTPNPLKDDCEELFYTLDVLLSTLGQPVFEPFNAYKIETNSITNITNNFDNDIDSNTKDLISNLNQNDENIPMVFSCNVKGGTAKGCYLSDDSFLMLAGSFIRKEIKPTMDKNVDEIRKQMIDQNKLASYDNVFYKLVEDYLFTSLNIASQIVTGRGTSGLDMWKNEKGKSFREIYR